MYRRQRAVNEWGRLTCLGAGLLMLIIGVGLPGTCRSAAVVVESGGAAYPTTFVDGGQGGPVEEERVVGKEGSRDYASVEFRPEIVQMDRPEYPEKAKEGGIEGKVILSVLVDKKGQAAKVQVAEAPDPDHGLAKAAVAVVKKAKFKPARAEGEIVACWIYLPFEFVLADKDTPLPPKKGK
ncbi:TonB family protein [candidate division GN15 bacterium]|nr:TonB family protein [candidate division GN15 bacterium]